MNTHDLRKRRWGSWRHSSALFCALAAMLVSGLAATNWANALYILTGAEDAAIILDGTAEAPDLSEQMVYVTSGSKGYDITLEEGLSVTVRRDDTSHILQSKNETISQLLDRLDIAPSPLEMVCVDLGGDSVRVDVGEEITYYDRVVEPAPFKTVRVPTAELVQGVERVVQEGVDGVQTSVYEVVWSNGEQISRQLVEQIGSNAVDQIVEYGTGVLTVERDDTLVEVIKNEDGSGTLVFDNGATLNYSSTKAMTATAYTGGYNGVGFITATGTDVHVGVAAVDRSVIPLGTRMFVVTSDGIVYGMAVAEDTGVRGNIIDLYHDTYRECIEFGRRSCTVYILD